MGRGYCEGRQIGASLPISDKMLKSSHCVPCVSLPFLCQKVVFSPVCHTTMCGIHHSPPAHQFFLCTLHHHLFLPFLLLPSPIHGHCRSLQVNHTRSTSRLPALKVTTWCFTCIVKHTGTVRDTHK